MATRGSVRWAGAGLLMMVAAACSGHSAIGSTLSAATPSGYASATPSPMPDPTRTATAHPVATSRAAHDDTASASTTSVSSVSTDPPSNGDGGDGGDATGVGQFGPEPAGSVTLPYEPGQSSWSATASGYHYDISVSPAAPDTGELTHWTIAVSPADPCCNVIAIFGNGAESDDTPCPAGGALHLTTTYNTSGEHGFDIGPGGMADCPDAGDIYGFLGIGAGASSAQGPDQPTITVDTSTPVAGDSVTAYGQGADQDGWVRSITISWGDGSADETFPNTSTSCVEGGDGRPAPSEMWLPGGDNPPGHRYTRPGTFTVTETVLSTGCDGGDPQHASGSFSWSVGAPPAPSTSAPVVTPTTTSATPTTPTTSSSH